MHIVIVDAPKDPSSLKFYGDLYVCKRVYATVFVCSHFERYLLPGQI